MINKNNKDQHLFELVVNDIKKKIFEGYYKPGVKLPNYVELTKIYDVSMSTIKKAMQELNDQGFLVSRVGKGTFINKEKLKEEQKRKNPSNKILFSIINSNDADFFQTLSVVRSVAESVGKEVVIDIHDDVHSQESALELISKENNYDLLILGTARKSVYGVKLYQKLSKRVPTIFCHDIYDSSIPVITVDNYATGKLAAKHLLEHSKRKICIVLDENGYKSDDLKMKGFMKTLEDNYSRSRCFVVRNSFKSKGSTFEDGYKLGSIIDLKSSEIDSVFASNDEVARGFYQAVLEKDSSKIEHLTILGFGQLRGNKKRKYNFGTIGINKKDLKEAYLSKFKEMCNSEADAEPTTVLLKPKMFSRK